MKKLASALLAAMMGLSMSVPLFAASTENGVLMEEISINLYDPAMAESIIEQYHLQPETANTIRSLLNQSKDSAANIDMISVSIPNTKARASGRTYKGFGNKTYYEEIVKVSNTSDEGTVGGTVWSNYKSSTVNAIFTFVADGAFDILTLERF